VLPLRGSTPTQRNLMNFKILWEHLSDPEYVHVLINPLPVYGLSIAVLALTLALFLRTQPLTIAALLLVFVCSISAWPTYRYGQAGYDRVKSMADDAGGRWLDEHMARAEKLIWAFFVLAGVSATGVAAVVRWPRSSFSISVLTLVLGSATLGVGGYIAYAGGHVRHREFRFEPPPDSREAEHHHYGDESEHRDEQQATTSPARQMEHAEHNQMQKPGGEKPPTDEEQEQLEASRLQLEASRLQLEASRKQLEAADAAKAQSPSPSPPQTPSPHADHGHEHKHEPKP
jgi:hypothetical protein